MEKTNSDKEYLRMIKRSPFDQKTKEEMLMNYCRIRVYIDMFIKNKNEKSDAE